MYCPQCRAEYRDGFTECSDCRVALIDAAPAEPDWIHTVREARRRHTRLGWILLLGAGLIQFVLFRSSLGLKLPFVFAYLIAAAANIWACGYIAKGKGYSGPVGALGLLHVVGLILLLLLPEKKIVAENVEREINGW
jgi:hypothetical protein